MSRRRLTIKRIDPWSVLKFGSIANVAMLAIFLLVMAVVWFMIDRLQVVDQICGIATDVGFTQCGINAGNMFRALIMLGLLWVVVQTAVLVFGAFLHNLIADLTGGLVVTVVDENVAGGAPATRAAHQGAPSRTTGSVSRQTGPQAGPQTGTTGSSTRSDTRAMSAGQTGRAGRPAGGTNGDELFQ